MKKIFVLLTACMLLLFGCNSKPSANIAKNSIGTQAVAISDDEASDSAKRNEDKPAQDDIASADDSLTETPPTLVAAPASSHLDDAPEDFLGDVIEIKEKLFIAQTNDIYFNATDYLGKTIKYEGIFNVYESPVTGVKYYSVIRYGPGCCGTDGNAGFEVIWDNDYPSQDDWVEAIGILEEYEEDGFNYLRLALSSLTVLQERGAEFVSQ